MSIYPENYTPILDVQKTERAIKSVKDRFSTLLSCALNLDRVTAPMFVKVGTGIQDNLGGTEKSVSFNVKVDGARVEVVHSLAKWKRMALKEYGYTTPGQGLYTDMNAIRCDEDSLDNTHSIYVDQWDWERVLAKEERNLTTLKTIVSKIYSAIRDTQLYAHREICSKIPFTLPEEITFVHAEELRAEFPGATDKEREDAITKRHGAVFLIGIGHALTDGKPHDGRAPDYDDWSSVNEAGYYGLNGDILVWNTVLGRALELSSMGIRVDEEALKRQLKISDAEDRLELDWHKRLLAGEFPYTIGGGIGQSRISMFVLGKAHIGEVQASYWPEETRAKCTAANIPLL